MDKKIIINILTIVLLIATASYLGDIVSQNKVFEMGYMLGQIETANGMKSCIPITTASDVRWDCTQPPLAPGMN